MSNVENNALKSDTYQAAMAAAYEMAGTSRNMATFDLYVRRLPNERNYLIAGGLELALQYLENLNFTEQQIQFLRKQAQFSDGHHAGFEKMLRNFRFEGNVWAVKEGMPVFAYEPIMVVQAPLAQANFVETYLLSVINSQTAWASKASRIVDAAHPAAVIDFGTRRIDPDAAVNAARAGYLGGFIGTSNMEAGMRYGIPILGTMAHSYVMSGEGMGPEYELQQFRQFVKVYPRNAVLLVDTYDIEVGIQNALTVAKEMKARGEELFGIRIDSGDIAFWSAHAKRVFESEGLRLRVTASNDLDEKSITALLNKGAMVDTFGVGTMFAGVGPLGGVYKEAEVEIGNVVQGRIKRSDQKSTYPGFKQAYYYLDRHGKRTLDEVVLADEERKGGVPLLEQVMSNGGRIVEAPSLEESRAFAANEKDKLFDNLRRIDAAEAHPVAISERLSGQQAEGVRTITEGLLAARRDGTEHAKTKMKMG